MKWRFFALFATLAVILVFVSSIEVVTLFHGSHNVIDITSSSNDINCTWCHQWVQDNLSNSAEGIHADFRCEDCHRIKDTEIVFASHGKSGEQAHAAYTPRCLDCHGGSGKQIESKFATPARAFNESTPLYGSDVSAHKPLVNWSLGYNLSVGENEACIACHTNYSIKNVFMRPEYFDFWISISGGGGGGGGGGGIDWTWSVNDLITYGSTNTTNISKSYSGAKHEFKAINQIKCEDCHLDVWQAANHPESNDDGSTKASHVCWKWGGSFKGKYAGREDPMHNVSYVGESPGYDNITDYCLSSCHKPVVKSSPPHPPVFDETVHAAYRVSCYHCHNSTTYTNVIENKPTSGWATPGFPRNFSQWHNKHEGHDVMDDNALAKPLFLHAETCISCKRGSCDSCHIYGNKPTRSQDFQTYTEPNNTMYMVYPPTGSTTEI